MKAMQACKWDKAPDIQKEYPGPFGKLARENFSRRYYSPSMKEPGT